MNTISYDEMYRAYEDCRKRKKKTRGAKRFGLYALYNVVKLTDDLNSRKYKLKPSSCFVIDYPTAREVFCADFRDRVAQHFVYNELNPVIEKKLINDTASCRVGKGTEYAIKRATRFLREATDNYTHDTYYLKIDLSGFFMSIDRELLYKKISGIIENDYQGKYSDELLYLCNRIILTDQTVNAVRLCDPKKWDKLPARKTLFGNTRGLPIGNITSQIFANYYLNDVDHFMKSHHRHFVRYVDDMVIFDNSKERLEETLQLLKPILSANNLTISQKKTKIGNAKYGVSFLGIKIKPHYNFLDKKRISRVYFMTKDIHDPDKMILSMASRKGMFKRYKGYNLYNRWFNQCNCKNELVKLKDYKLIRRDKLYGGNCCKRRSNCYSANSKLCLS